MAEGGNAGVDTATLVDGLMAARRAPLDDARPGAVAKQRARSAWTARERIDALVDPGTFREYGLLARAAQTDVDAPADGLVTGIARVRDRPIVVAAYDYTVLGGSQGSVNNTKIGRILQLAEDSALPVVIFAEG